MENKKPSFGAQVKSLRQSKRLSQQDLSYWSGLSLNKIIQIEKGKLVPNLKMVNDIAVAMGAQILDLMSFSSLKKLVKLRNKGMEV